MVGLGFCISNKSPGDADAAGLRISLCVARPLLNLFSAQANTLTLLTDSVIRNEEVGFIHKMILKHTKRNISNFSGITIILLSPKTKQNKTRMIFTFKK